MYHAEITAIIDASARLNPKGLLGTEYGAGTMLENDPARATGIAPLVTETRQDAQRMRNLHQRRTVPDVHDRHPMVAHKTLFSGASLEDNERGSGFSDAFQYEDFAKPWSERHIPIAENFERDMTMKSYKAWMDKEDRHPY